jgi:hypothetical protein
MTQGLKTAIDEVNKVIEAKLREVLELKRSVNALCQQAGLEVQYGDLSAELDGVGRTVLRPDTFYGQPLATAVRGYLEGLRHAISVPDILTALQQGGFDFDSTGWSPENHHRNLAISLSKNPVFKRLPSGAVGLKTWYQEAPTKTIRRKKHRSAKRNKLVGVKPIEKQPKKTQLEQKGRDATQKEKTVTEQPLKA